MIWVGGTTAAIAGGAEGGNDIVAQTKEVLRRIGIALQEADASFADVVRVRVFVTNVERWLEITNLLRETFPHKPAATMVGVKQLVAPWLLVEIEADAVVQPSRD